MLHVIVGAAALFVFGAVWYTLLFGKLWAKLSEFSPESQARMKGMGMAKPMIMNFVLQLITAYVVYYLYPQIIALTFSSFLEKVVLIWFAFSFSVYANQAIWEGKQWKLVFLNTAYGLISVFIISLIVYYWPVII